jgi:hypothetical protein
MIKQEPVYYCDNCQNIILNPNWNNKRNVQILGVLCFL